MKETILQALGHIQDPDIHQDIVSLHMIRDLVVQEGKASLTIVVPTFDSALKERVEKEVKGVLRTIEGLKDFSLQIDSKIHSAPRPMPGSRLETVKNIIAVASGKGGVGKSTVAVNLAAALAQSGAQVGILDADIYGPSLPTLMGLKNTPPLVDEAGKKILPLEKYGIKTMSIGYLMKEQDAAVWRGPMVGRMIQQFIEDVAWGELDYLVIDLPPGTGDAQLSLSQLIPISGAVIVTTPQDVALADVVRGVAMFSKVQIPILGVVENMSYFSCPHCHGRSEVFSYGGGRKKAEELKVPFLGEIPLQIATRIGSDEGKPIVVSQPDSEEARGFKALARRTAVELTAIHAAPTVGA